jgi:hypothetical protein
VATRPLARHQQPSRIRRERLATHRQCIDRRVVRRAACHLVQVAAAVSRGSEQPIWWRAAECERRLPWRRLERAEIGDEQCVPLA